MDFAYAVHTDVGRSCVAVKIDRRLMPLRTELRNGQTVEIITAPGARPNPAHDALARLEGEVAPEQLSVARSLPLEVHLGQLLVEAFGPLELHRVEAVVLPENEPSRRLLARGGFRLEGVSRSLVLVRGAWRDHERWALTREDWSG